MVEDRLSTPAALAGGAILVDTFDITYAMPSALVSRASSADPQR